MNVILPKKLERNFLYLFLIKAFLNVKVLNVVSTLFYVSRGMSIAQIFYTGVIWSVSQILFEIPSSYLADIWGRKKTIICGIGMQIIAYVLLVFWRDIYGVYVSFVFLGIAFACMSGTDEALLYDTTVELKLKEQSLQKLGNLYAAERAFKIFTPTIAVLIAKDLLDWQFTIILWLDVLATFCAFICASKLVEAPHHVDVENQEARVLDDAWKLLKKDKVLINAICSRALIFIASFILWRLSQEYFTTRGISVVLFGIVWSGYHLTAFFITKNIQKWHRSTSIFARINTLNNINVLLILSIMITAFFPVFLYITYALYLLFILAETVRGPLYAELYNARSKSYNRATTLSLLNYVKNFLDIPILALVGYLSGFSVYASFIISSILGMIVIVFFRFQKSSE